MLCEKVENSFYRLLADNITDQGFSNLKDEIEFLDFIALFKLNGLHDRLSSFSLYNPYRENFYSMISIDSETVTYKEANSKPVIRTFKQVEQWLIITPNDNYLFEINPILDGYLTWRIHLTFCTVEGIILKSQHTSIGKKLTQKATGDWKQDRLCLIKKIDDYILSVPDILEEFLEPLDIYHGLQIYKFEHTVGTTLVAKKDDVFRSEVIRLTTSSGNLGNFYQSIDDWILTDAKEFRRVANVFNSLLLSKSYYLKMYDAFYFKSYFRQSLIIEFTCSGEEQECIEIFLKELEKVLLDKVLNDQASYNYVAHSKFYGQVLQLRYFDIPDRHHIKIQIGETEVLSCFGGGRAETKIRSYIDSAVKKNQTEFTKIFEENHKEFKKEKIGPYAPVSIMYDEKKYLRVTHCWNCKNDIDSLNFALCEYCSGIVCFCGACFCSHTGY